MNLELLISKYIDGELTASEDEQLRHLLKEDPAAREEFDSFLELHLAMIEDADTIVIPTQVKRATEDRVMMAILNDTPKIIPINKSYNTYYKAAAVAVFLMFAFLFQVNDKFYHFTDASDNVANNKNEITEKEEIGIIKTPSTNKKSSKKSNLKTSSLAQNTISNESISSTEVALVTNNIVDNPTVNSNSRINSIVENQSNTVEYPLVKDNKTNSETSFNSNKQIEITNSSMDLALPKDISNADLFFNISQNEINLTTSISYDFLRNGISTYENSTIKNFSQSISYSINESSRIGLEFGLTEFYYPMTHYIKVNSSVNNNSKVEILEPGNSDDYILVPIIVRESEKNYWGTVFFEQNILNYGEFALDGRLGLGSTTDGYLGIGRIIAKYNILSGLYISAGAEGRSFSYNLPLKNSRGIANNLSYVWGIYFQF